MDITYAYVGAQSSLTLHDPMDCSTPASSVHGILQARIQEWIAIPYSTGFKTFLIHLNTYNHLKKELI